MLLILDFSIIIHICKRIVRFLSQLHFILDILEYMEFKIWRLSLDKWLLFIINILYVQFSVWDWT